MPSSDGGPASLTPAEYWALTAYLARAHGTLPEGARLEAAAAAAAIPIAAPAPATSAPAAGPAVAQPVLLVLGALAGLGGLTGWMWLQAQRRRGSG